MFKLIQKRSTGRRSRAISVSWLAAMGGSDLYAKVLFLFFEFNLVIRMGFFLIGIFN